MSDKGVTLKYHKEAKGFLFRYLAKHSGEERLYFNFDHMAQVADIARRIAYDLGLNSEAYENVLVAAWFRFACMGDPIVRNVNLDSALIRSFFNEVGYPLAGQTDVIRLLKRNIAMQYPQNESEAVLWDASYSWLAAENILAKVHLFKEDVNRFFIKSYTEIDVLKIVYEQYIESQYYTRWAQEHLSKQKEKNLLLIERRMEKVIHEEAKKVKAVTDTKNSLGTKETEDLFKIAFRNYNHLVSIADSKASLLIQVNALLISFVVAFVLSKIDRYPLFIFPSSLLLFVCVAVISLSVLASRPRSNLLNLRKHMPVYQKFFFGSFDQVDNGFSKLSWDIYQSDLEALLKSGRENLYEEVYKESYNVRKLLAYKFRYLSIAYWVFLLGLAFSMTGFIVSLHYAFSS